MTERISVQAVKAIEGVLAELEAEKARVADAYRQEQALVAEMKTLNQERQAVAEAFRQLEAASEELKALGLLDAAQEVTEQASRAFNLAEKRVENKAEEIEALGLTDELRTIAKASLEAEQAEEVKREAEAHKAEAERKVQMDKERQGKLAKAKELVGEEYARTKFAARKILEGAAVKSPDWKRVARALEAAGVTRTKDASKVCKQLAVGAVLGKVKLNGEQSEKELLTFLSQELERRYRDRRKKAKTEKPVQRDSDSNIKVKGFDGSLLDQLLQQVNGAVEMAQRLGYHVHGEIRPVGPGIPKFYGNCNGEVFNGLKVTPGWEYKLVA